MDTTIAQLEAHLRRVLGPEADALAQEVGFVRRKREISGSIFVLGLVFGWLEKPHATVEELCQALGYTRTRITGSGLSQRFSKQAVQFMERVFERLVQFSLRVPPADLELLKRFSAVVVEDSTQISLPDALVERWRACGNGGKRVQAGVKVHVQWDLLSGQIVGPELTEGRHSDQQSPLRKQMSRYPDNWLYLCDNGYFSVHWFKKHTSQHGFVLSRPKVTTAFFDENATRLDLRELGPEQVGACQDRPVQVGAQDHWPARLIMVRVPEEVAQLRRERLRRQAQRKSREANPRALALADWTILVTNAPMDRLSTAEVLVMQRARWQIERLFRLWKEDGLLDEWRSKKPERIVCELYGKLMGLLIQQWMSQLTVWSDPMRSLVKVAGVVRRFARDLCKLAQGHGTLTAVLEEIGYTIGATCRINTRKEFPSTAQLLQGNFSSS